MKPDIKYKILIVVYMGWKRAFRSYKIHVDYIKGKCVIVDTPER